MARTTALSSILLHVPAICAAVYHPRSLFPRDDGYDNPTSNGGSMLTIAPNADGLGEPLNLIISSQSDSDILDVGSDQFSQYWYSVGFGGECLGQHEGDAQTANLGDGSGYVNQTAELRWDYYDATIGTCTESVEGGNHLRYWVQNGSAADTGAIFFAASYELSADENHDIVVNGYNLGRDQIVGNATAQNISSSSVSSSSTYQGSTSYGTYQFQTSVQYVSGLFNSTMNGINHASSVGVNGLDPIDGLVAVMTVKITSTTMSDSTSAASALTFPPRIWQLPALTALAALLAPLLMFGL